MIGEEFKVGDLVRILTPEEMLADVRTIDPGAIKIGSYDVVDAMQNMGGVIARIIEHHSSQATKSFMSNRYSLARETGGLIGLPISYAWYDYCITKVEHNFNVPLDEWSSLL